MADPLSRGHSLLADYLDAFGVVPLPISEVHMNAPVPTREHVGEDEGAAEGNCGVGNRSKTEARKMHGGVEREEKK